MNVEEHHETAVSRIAAAIGEPARARMLFCLMDGHARTSTELAAVADVATSTASAHLNRLKAERLVKLVTQGKHLLLHHVAHGTSVDQSGRSYGPRSARPRSRAA